MGEHAIVTRGLRRVFTKRTALWHRREQIVAVDSIDLAVPTGTVFGMLGPNGAGKTTTIKMVSTLLVPTGGEGSVGGYDIVREEARVRRCLGVVLGGDRGLYGKLSGRDNLVYFGSLYGMPAKAVRRRADELFELIQLEDRAKERVEAYSRGMKQRLHLAKALLHQPPILILDEPTIGLDPAAAVVLRGVIAELVPRHTVLLTTHDMHEADQLCHELAIVDQGHVVARGTPEEVKAMAGGGSSRRPADSSTSTSSTSTTVVDPSLEDAFLALTGKTLD